MRLWGQVVSGSLLTIAAVFAVAGFVVPDARNPSLGAAAIAVAVVLFGVPMLVDVEEDGVSDDPVGPGCSLPLSWAVPFPVDDLNRSWP